MWTSLGCLLLIGPWQVHAQPIRVFREDFTFETHPEAARSIQILLDRWEESDERTLAQDLYRLEETWGDALVPVEVGQPGRVAHYQALRLVTHKLLTTLSPEGLSHYRRLIDPLAARWADAWKQHRDEVALKRLVTRASLSSWGDWGLWEWGHVLWMRGELSSALWAWSPLLPSGAPGRYEPCWVFPHPRYAESQVAARCVACRLLAGHSDEAVTALEEIRQRESSMHTDESQFGEQKLLELQQLAPALAYLPHDSGYTLGGSAQRHGGWEPFPLARSVCWQAWLLPQRLPEVVRYALYPQPPLMPYHPLIVDDIVFLNEGSRILAWRLFDGKPAFGDHPQIYPVIGEEQLVQPQRATSGQVAWTLSVSQQRLWARMGSAVTNPASREFRDLTTEVVCLDLAQQGRLLWKITADDWQMRLQEPPELPAWNWEGTPVFSRGKLFAALSRRRPLLEWCVVALDAQSGQLLWQRSLGSSRQVPEEFENRASQVLVTIGDGVVYLATGCGALVALDEEQGQWLWAVATELSPSLTGVASNWAGPDCCVYAQGRLISLPRQEVWLRCFDGRSGNLLWQQPRPDPQAVVVGCQQGVVVVQGEGIAGYSLRDGHCLWRHFSLESDEKSHGRAWMTAHDVWWPQRQHLTRIDLLTGTPRDLFIWPTAITHGVTVQPGHCVAGERYWVVAGSSQLTVFGPDELIPKAPLPHSEQFSLQ